MSIFHFLLIMLVVIIWGINFLTIKSALTEMSPLFLCSLRFLLASIPAVFFIKPPNLSFKIVAFYGLIMFSLQFGLLFLGIDAGMTAGMASLIMQMQVFFSMFFAAMLLAEQPNIWQISGALIAFAGIGIVILHVDHETSLLGLILILAAAATWGFGNLIVKKNQPINMIALIIWGNLIAFIPMSILCLSVEGFNQCIDALNHVTWKSIGSLLYIVYISTWIGYGLWNWLLMRYPLSSIAPFTLLVPIVGILGSVLFLNETFESWKLTASLLVVTGLFINVLGMRLLSLKRAVDPATLLAKEP